MNTVFGWLRGLVLCLALSAAACTGAGDGPGLSGSALPAELDVAPAISLSCFATPELPPADFNRVLDVVALPARPNYRNTLQTSERVAEDGTRYYFAKAGLWYRADAKFELRVPEELQTSMAFGWGVPAEPAHTVNVRCERSGDWIVLPGGFWVSEPLCATVIVRAGSIDERVEVGVGAPCLGQAPPVVPSDG